MYKISNLLIKPEPDDILDPCDELSSEECKRALAPFMPLLDKDKRWYKCVTGFNEKRYIISGIREADYMMSYEPTGEAVNQS